ncbi:PIG-L family deacetylase [Methylophilaceae bacterium]|nr:PIG-L family deacetylase [Methylophilaceae bacterium]
MNKDNILIIAAHPDDDILGCGGFISKYRKTKVFKVIFIAEGSTSRFDNPDSVEANSALVNRQNMAVNALKKLGVSDIEFNNLPCGKLDQIPLLEINKIIEKGIDEFKPTMIFTHSASDLNQDHKIINKSTLIATRPLPNRKVESLLSFEVLSSSEWNFSKYFSPNFFEEMTFEDIKNKQEAMAIYQSEMGEFPFPRSNLGIETLARYRGMQSGYNFSEAYEVIRIFR